MSKIDGLIKRRDELRRELNLLEGEELTADVIRQKRALRAQLDAVEEELNGEVLGSERYDSREAIASILNDRAHATKVLYNVENRIRRAEDRIKTYKIEIAKLQEENRSLKGSLGRVKYEKEDSQKRAGERIRRNQELINNYESEISALTSELNELREGKRILVDQVRYLTEENKVIRKKHKGFVKSAKIVAIIASVVLASGALAGHFIMNNIIDEKDDKYNKVTEDNKDLTETLNQQLTEEDMQALNQTLEAKFGKILTYRDVEKANYAIAMDGTENPVKTGVLTVYAEKDGVVSVYDISLPEGVESLDNLTKATQADFIATINNSEFTARDSFSKTEEKLVVVDGKILNLNGTVLSNGENVVISKPEITAKTNEEGKVTHNEVNLRFYVGGNDATIPGKFYTATIYLGANEISTNSSAQEVFEAISGKVESASGAKFVEAISGPDALLNAAEAGSYNFLPRLNLKEIENEVKNSISDTEISIEDAFSLVQADTFADVKEFTEILSEVDNVLIIKGTDSIGRESIYKVSINENEIESCEQFVSLDEYVEGYESSKVKIYKDATGKLPTIVDDTAPIYVKTSVGKENGEYKGSLDVICVGYNKGNPEIYEFEDVLTASSKKTISATNLVKTLVAEYANEKPLIPGTSSVNWNSGTTDESSSELNK